MSLPRVLEVVASSRGGGAVHVRALALWLAQEGWPVTVAMPSDGGSVSAADFTSAGVGWAELPIATGLQPGAWLRLRALARAADLVHAHGARAALFARLAVASLPRRPRLLYTIHGFAAPHYGAARRTALLASERLLAPWTDGIIAVSQAERRDVLAARVCAPSRVTVVPNGIARAPFDDVRAQRSAVRAALGIAPEAPLIITVCRLYRPRDFSTLLHALHALAERLPDVQLVIAGDGPYWCEIEALSRTLALAERVHLLGLRHDVPALLGASDLFVLATAGWEGLPLTLLEAMAAGLPAVASRVGGIPEALAEGETGLIVPPGDPEALAEAMGRMLSDVTLSRRMGQAGQARVATHFTLERMASQIMNIYERLLSPK